jgi:hypothetical protein
LFLARRGEMSPSRKAGDGRHAPGRWRLAAAAIALIAGPLVLYQVLPLIGVPVALASGAVAVILLKHLGILAVLLTPMYALLRRRPRR